MRAISITLFFAGALNASAQIPTPMHVPGPNGTLLVGRNIEVFAAMERSLRTVTVIDRAGVRVEEVKGFVHYTAPYGGVHWSPHLAARLDHEVRPGGLYFPGEVQGVQLFAPGERTVYFWGGDTLDPLLLNAGRDLRYIWNADSTGERTLAVQELNDHYAPRAVTNYHIRRSGCHAWQGDSVAVVHCRPDVAYEEREPAFVFVLVNGELVHAWGEPAHAEMGPGTHHYLLATLAQGPESALLFTTGEMLVQRDHHWRLRVDATPDGELSMIKRR